MAASLMSFFSFLVNLTTGYQVKRIFMQKSLSCVASGLESFHLHVHSADRRNADQVSPGPRGEVGEDVFLSQSKCAFLGVLFSCPSSFIPTNVTD